MYTQCGDSTLSESCLAQEALRFAFFYDENPERSRDPEATAQALQQIIRNLWQHTNTIAWEHEPQQPDGVAEQPFVDDSALHLVLRGVKLSTAPPSGLHRDDSCYVGLTVLHHTDQTQNTHVAYRIPRNEQTVLCETDRAFGMKALGALKVYNELQQYSISSAPFRHELFLETELVLQGLDPDLDPDIAALRQASGAYRLVSDATRQELRLHQLDQQLGTLQERPAGPGEVQYLKSLLHTF